MKNVPCELNVQEQVILSFQIFVKHMSLKIYLLIEFLNVLQKLLVFSVIFSWVYQENLPVLFLNRYMERLITLFQLIFLIENVQSLLKKGLHLVQ